MKRKLTPSQELARDARREKFRALWKQVADMPEPDRLAMAQKFGIRNIEGRVLSLANMMLIILQNPKATIVGGFRQWIAQGRAVTKGEHGMMIWCPCKPKQENGAAPALVSEPNPEAENDLRFIVGTVFDIAQTHEIETGKPVVATTEPQLELV